MNNLYKWYVLLAICISILSAACLCTPGAANVCLEETGHTVGIGNHSIEVVGGNLTGNVTGWHVIRCNNTGMWEVDL